MVNWVVLERKKTSAADFIRFWSSLYADPLEHLYAGSMVKPLTPDKVYNLFTWKNGVKLSERKKHSVKVNFIDKLDTLDRLPPETSPEDFLDMFSDGGAIWRIFWLHCWQPSHFPIYDMHVHRAMMYLEIGTLEELSNLNDTQKIDLYVDRYLEFVKSFDGVEIRQIDRALWTFGKFIKEWQLAPLGSSG